MLQPCVLRHRPRFVFYSRQDSLDQHGSGIASSDVSGKIKRSEQEPEARCCKRPLTSPHRSRLYPTGTMAIGQAEVCSYSSRGSDIWMRQPLWTLDSSDRSADHHTTTSSLTILWVIRSTTLLLEAGLADQLLLAVSQRIPMLPFSSWRQARIAPKWITYRWLARKYFASSIEILQLDH